MLTHPAIPRYGQIAPRVTPHQQDRDDFSTIIIDIGVRIANGKTISIKGYKDIFIKLKQDKKPITFFL
jgi:hypothetical protein